MEAYRQLDFARRSEAFLVRFLAIRVLAGLLFPLPSAVLCSAQEIASKTNTVAAAEELYEKGQWERLIQSTNDSAVRTPELDYLRGMALMRLGRYAEAREAFSAGYRVTPDDTRFLVERAGAEYRLKDFRSAKSDLRRSLRPQPKDEYSLEFLGTIYLLENNLDAALKYWNRVGKPRLGSVVLEPVPRVKAELCKNAVTFNAPQVLPRASWLTTDARLENLGTFPRRRLELAPAGDENYSAILHVSERDGRDNLGWTGLVSLLSGVPYQTVYPDWYNIGSRAINFSSMARWDRQKRRAFASLAFPVRGQSNRVASIFVDGRDENWNLSQTFTGGSLPLDNLNLRSIEGGVDLRSVINGDWSWNAGVGVIGRTFRNAGIEPNPGAAGLFLSSTTLKSRVGATHTLLEIPERRFTVVGAANFELGRGFKQELGTFGSLGGSLRTEWLPHASGDEDSLHIEVRTAETFGTVPLDQLFELGLDRDSPLWLRGHIATIDGKKGRAPLGRRFALLNIDYDRTLYNSGFLRLQAGPLVDMGKISDSSGVIGDPRWLVDAGVQVKLRVLGAVSVVLSYGRDLRNGEGAFFGTTER